MFEITDLQSMYNIYLVFMKFIFNITICIPNRNWSWPSRFRNIFPILGHAVTF